ncbi:MAG: (2Fe-2S)-binding protein [Candidatus Metalachnospira sp.]|nr:(2Fe-2S)-binding protein [Candidatus Metalachnospira sp.]
MAEFYADREKKESDFVEMDDDDLIICRCEEITKGEIRKSIYDGLVTMNEIKRFLRPGMGLCQGTTCTRNIKMILAKELGVSIDKIDEPTPRAPMRPITLGEYGNEKE